jgi:phospholipase/carboxylesterase
MTSPVSLREINGWTFKERKPASPGNPPLLMLFHGWTGDENVMWIFAKGFSERYWIIAPRAPFATPLGGFGWQNNHTSRWSSMKDFEPAIELFDAIIVSTNFPGVNFNQVHAIGFSQGAAFMYSLALSRPGRIKVMAGLSGFVPSDAADYTNNKPLEDIPIFIAHGRQDELVPVERARSAVALLESAGAKVAYCEEDVGHKLSLSCFQGLEHFFSGIWANNQDLTHP